MADTPQYFDSPDSFVLIVGQVRKKLYVARPVLEQIPFFSSALKNDQFKEAREKVFEMPEDDPRAVSDLLHFVFADYVKPIEDKHGFGKSEDEGEVLSATARAYTKAFVAADKFVAEKTANQILNCLHNYFTINDIDPDCIDILSSAGLQHTKLYEFLIYELTARMKSAINQGMDYGAFDKYFATDSNSFPSHLTSDTMLAVLRSLTSKNEYGTSIRYTDGLCFLHTHVATEVCPGLNHVSSGWK